MPDDLPISRVSAVAGIAGTSLSAAPAVPGLASPAANAASSTPEPSSPPTSEEIKKAVEQANQALAQNGMQLSFVFDDQVHRLLVKIVDAQTHKVVQQIPSEAMLAAARALSGSTTSGTLVNTKA